MYQDNIDWAGFDNLNALIVGDVMIDRYLKGTVERISPEAPVPVVLLAGRESRLGGAANVALNVQAMGAQARLCSVIGDDPAGDEFLELMKAHGLPTEGILKSAHRITTRKTRVMAGAQHLLRLDEETTEDLVREDEDSLMDKVRSMLDTAPVKVIIFQDYNKGVLTKRVIELVLKEAGARQIPTAVDPKEKNFWAYQGVSLFKPNLREIRRQYPGSVLPEMDSLLAAAAYIRSQTGNRIALITLSEKGVFVEEEGRGVVLPTHARVIADVSGAGDTVISVAALGLALGLPATQLATLANLAGGQVCEKPGVVPVDRYLLQSAFQKL